ncbi:MAG TPA: polysaccharide deacetylase family protein [Novosphingobium sp.]
MIRALARSALTRAPLYSLLRRRALARSPLTILCYHTLSGDTGGPDAWTALRLADFRDQIAALRRHYRIVSLDEALDWWEDGARAGPPPAVLTFDDGDRGLHQHLLPLLREDPVPVTVYVATSQIQSGSTYWFDRVANACGGHQRLEIDLADAGLGRIVIGGSGEARWLMQSALHDRLKQVDPATREALADRIAAQAPEPAAQALGPMTLAQLQELAAHPQVTIGAHSHCHNLLDQLPLDAARDSIVRNVALLQEWTGQSIAHFAYPNGNYNRSLMALVQDLGFRSATILDNGPAWPGTSLHALSRIAVGRYDTLDRIRLRLAGI